MIHQCYKLTVCTWYCLWTA